MGKGDEDTDSDSDDDTENSDVMPDSLGEIVEDLRTDVECLESLTPALEFPAQDHDWDRALSPIRQVGNSPRAKSAHKVASRQNEHPDRKREVTGKDLQATAEVEEEREKNLIRENLDELVAIRIKEQGKSNELVARLMSRVGFSREEVEYGLGNRLKKLEEDLNAKNLDNALNAEEGNNKIGETSQPRRKKGKAAALQQPTYPKIHKDFLSIDTLRHYGLPYEYDRSDPNYFIILFGLDHSETEVLFEHTRRLRAKAHTRALEERGPEESYPWRRVVNRVKRKSESTRSSPPPPSISTPSGRRRAAEDELALIPFWKQETTRENPYQTRVDIPNTNAEGDT